MAPGFKRYTLLEVHRGERLGEAVDPLIAKLVKISGVKAE